MATDNEYIEITNDSLMYHKPDGTVVKLLPTIKELLSAEKADRPQGEWIYCEDYVGHDGYECSNCGFFIPWVYDCYADANFIKNYHTCPHCDARMKGVDDE